MNRLKKKDNSQSMRRVNYIKESEDEDESEEEDEEQFVLRVDGEGTKPFYMEERCAGTTLKRL